MPRAHKPLSSRVGSARPRPRLTFFPLRFTWRCTTWHSRKKVPMAGPDVHSIFEVKSDAAAEARLVAEVKAAFAAGRVVPHERLRKWLGKLANGG